MKRVRQKGSPEHLSLASPLHRAYALTDLIMDAKEIHHLQQ